MDVQCPQCQTIFEFDEKQLRGAHTTLKCGVCTHLFRVDTALSAQTESLGRWMVKSVLRGDVLYFTGFDQLHRWLMEGTVSPNDALSRTGNSWTTLSEIGELLPIFQTIESIQRISNSSPALKLTPLDGPPQKKPVPQAPSEPDRPRAQTIQQFASAPVPGYTAPQAPDVSTIPPADNSPSWAMPSGELPVAATESLLQINPSSESGSFNAPPVKSSRRLGGVLAMLIVLGAIGAGVYVWFYRPDLLKQPETLEAAKAKTSTTATSTTPKEAPEVTALKVLDEKLALSVTQALNEATQQNQTLWDQTLTQSRQGLAKALEDAEEKAKKKAQKPSSSSLLSQAGKALRRNDAVKAHKLYHEALDLNPRNPAALTGLGWALLAQGRVDAASIQFKRSIHTRASYGDAYIGLGKTERLKGNLRAALGAYDNYLARFPSGRKASIARHQSKELRQTLGL